MKTNNRYQLLCFTGMTVLVMIVSGCKKLVDVAPPTTSITGASVYTADATAAAVMTGMYANISTASPVTVGAIPSLSLYPELSGDELTLWSGVITVNTNSYYKNSLSANTAGYEYWNTLYPYILRCNLAIEGLNASTSLTPAVKQQLLGEAIFMRAFFYFYLVNLYGDVPLSLSSDYTATEALSRAPAGQVYLQIITDLRNAANLLSPNFLDATVLNNSAERVRPSKWAAEALLARTYLYYANLGNSSYYAKADSAASVVIANTAQFSLSTINNVFLRAGLGNNEAIWQLQPVNTNSSYTNTPDAYFFIITTAGPGQGANSGAYLSNGLLNSFEAGDLRKMNWVGSVTANGILYYYPYKYKLITGPVNEYSMMLRLGEQYLIRAEARAQEGNIAGTQADLNAIRTRAGLSNTTAATQGTLLTAIMQERRVELFTELGHRWLDLKRTGTVDLVMGTGGACAAKGGTWVTTQQLYPLPPYDLQLDHNLKQNSGY